MTTKNIIGYYERYLLVEQDDIYYVVKRKPDNKILCKGSKDYCKKAFVMLISEFIKEEDLLD